VFVGTDPVATAQAALGVGREQATRRRVAIGDLFAESPPLQELVRSDDPHGLVDSFRYGVSLNRIAHQVEDADQLFVMPSGSEPPDYDEILPNPRWRRLAAGFQESGALLILIVPVSAQRLEDLVAATDGAILVGDFVPRFDPTYTVLGVLRAPRAERPSRALERPSTPVIAPVVVPRRRIGSFAGVAVATFIGVMGLWLAARPLASARRITRRPLDSTGVAKQVLASGVAGRSASAAPTVDSGSARPPLTVPEVANPSDSAAALAFAVKLTAANTQAGAILRLQQDGKNMPAATFAPVLEHGMRWFKVMSGALADRGAADSLLLDLRRRGLLDARDGFVVRAPFAFLIDSNVPAPAVPGLLATYLDRGQPVYALRQPNGKAWLLAGAFESREEAALYAESLRRSGPPGPVLVYRKGRPF
jgi:hypothetical protein